MSIFTKQRSLSPRQNRAALVFIFCGLASIAGIYFYSQWKYPGGMTSTQSRMRTSFDDGFDRGVELGQISAQAHEGIPTKSVLHAIARMQLNIAHPSDSDEYVRGVEWGFESGYKQAVKPAF